MHAEGFSLWHVVVHYTKDTFFHFTSVRSSENDLLLRGEVHIDGGLTFDFLDVIVSNELTSVKDSEVWTCLEIFFDFLVSVSDKHLFHEIGMIGSCRDNSSLDLEFFIPSCILVNNEDLKFRLR